MLTKFAQTSTFLSSLASTLVSNGGIEQKFGDQRRLTLLRVSRRLMRQRRHHRFLVTYGKRSVMRYFSLFHFPLACIHSTFFKITLKGPSATEHHFPYLCGGEMTRKSIQPGEMFVNLKQPCRCCLTCTVNTRKVVQTILYCDAYDARGRGFTQ